MTDVLDLEVSTPSDCEIRIARTFDAPRELRFDAFTRPEFLSRWMWGPDDWPIVVCEIDVRVGGALRYVWRHADKGDMAMSGAFRVVERPARLVHSELFDDDWTGGETVVTTTFAERGAGAEVVMTLRYASKQARDAVLASGMTDGLSQCYARLDGLLAAQGRDLRLTREFDAPRELVWEAWSKPEHIRRWFCPDAFTIPECRIDFRPGGVSEVCMRAPDGSDHWSKGRYLEIDPPRRIVTVGAVAGADGLAMFEARTTVTFEALGAKTVVEVHQAYALFDLRAAAALGGAPIGWGQTLDKLEALLPELEAGR